MAFYFYMEVIPPLSSNLVPTIPVFMLVWSSSQVPHTSRVEDFFSMINLNRTPFCFLNLNEEKREEKRDGVYSSGEAHP
jgi:hypothetical protein